MLTSKSSGLDVRPVGGLVTPEPLQAKRAPSFYKPELDILRFFAFLGVFICHTAIYNVDFLVSHHLSPLAAKIGLSFAHAGAYGVDVFFVLSAYLITELLLREKETTGTLNVPAFYLRRILRIWPLYYFFIAIAVLIPFVTAEQHFGLHYLIPFLILLGNWSFIAFGPPQSIAGPLWSVSVEEQFYLFWPPVVARLSRRGIIFAALSLIGVANIARIIEVSIGMSNDQIWVNTFSHVDSIAAGILIAVVWRERASFFNVPSRLIVIACAVCCLTTVAYFDFDMSDGPRRASVLGTLISYPLTVITCTVILLAFINLPIRSRALQYLGKISYGLYVYHLLSYLIIDKLWPGGGAGPMHAFIRMVFALALTIAISAASYRVIEQPFLKLKRRFTYISSRPV